MAVPTNKVELIKAINVNYSKLKKELSNIPDELTSIQELDGHSEGTLMSINNLVGWGELVLKWNKRKEKNETIDFPETRFKWNELGKLAQKFYKYYQNDGILTLTEKLDKTVEQILSLIENKTNEDLYETSWYEK